MMKLPRKPIKELTQLAKDIVTNLVFIDRYLRDQSLLPTVFMPIALGALSENSKEIGMIYEYYNQAGPMAINGYPMFFSCRMLGKKDAEVVMKKVKKFKDMFEKST